MIFYRSLPLLACFGNYDGHRKLLKLVETLQLERACRDDDDEDGRAWHYRRRPAAAVRGEHREEEKSCRNGGKIRSGNSASSNNHRGGGDDNDDVQDEEETDDRGGLTPTGNPRLFSTETSTRRLGATSTRHATTTAAAAAAAGSGSGSGGDDHDRFSAPITREDLRRLRLENRNMHLLLVENRELKKQAREESAGAEGARRELEAELAGVKGELGRVSRELRAARDRLVLLQGGAVSRWAGSQTRTVGVLCVCVCLGFVLLQQST